MGSMSIMHGRGWERSWREKSLTEGKRIRWIIDGNGFADVVIPVPDSSIPAAVGFSRMMNSRINDGFIKNRYVGRTFIEPIIFREARRSIEVQCDQ